MATWFATAAGNINSAGRWNSLPNGTGTTLTWPPASGDVLMANNRIITINVNTDLGQTGEIRNDTFGGATAGGYFTWANGVSLTANIFTGVASSACTAFTVASGFLVGNVTGGSASSFSWGINFASTGTLNITGNITGGTSGTAVYNDSTGTINITGNVTNNGGSTSFGVRNAKGGAINITGNVSGGSLSSAYAIRNDAAGTVTITGSVTSGSGANAAGASNIGAGTLTINGTVSADAQIAVRNDSSGIVNIDGTVTGGNASSSGIAVRNFASGQVNITGNAIAGSSANAIRNDVSGSVTLTGYALASNNTSAIQNDAQGIVSIGETRSASNGRGAVLGAFRFASATAAKSLPIIAGTQQTLSVLDVAALVPAIEDVRAGVTYGDGAYTGTLALQRKRTTMAGRF